MDFFKHGEMFVLNNFVGIIIIITLIITLRNIIVSVMTPKNKKKCKNQLKRIFFWSRIIFFLLSIFIFDFIYHERYILETVKPPTLKVTNILVPQVIK
jgi:hypothetical protein